MVYVEALAAWRRQRGGAVAGDALRVLAAQIPEIVAAAVFEAFVEVSGPHKRSSAAVLAGAWFVVTSALLDRLRSECGDVPELNAVPQKVDMLRHIFDPSATVKPRSQS
jgi:hypothetical protein